MEVRSLLSRVMLDMSGHESGNLIPKRPNPVVILTPSPHKLRDLSRLVDTSSQVSMVRCLEEVPTTISPIAVTPGSRSVTPPTDAGQLWEKVNKALEELQATKSSIDTCRQKVVWELDMELCWNDSKMVESIKEARAICTHATLDAEAFCSAAVKEGKATCTSTVQQTKAICSTAIRDAETWGASQAESLHRQHAKTIKHLEEQVIQEEGKSQSLCLSSCLTSQPCWPQRCTGRFLSHIDGAGTHTPLIHLITRSLPYWATICLSSTFFSSTWAFPQPKRQHPSPDLVDDMPLGGTTSKTTSEGPSSSKWWEIPPWYKVLKQSHSEAFRQDTSLVREARKEYFKKHSPNFTMDGMHDLSEVYRCLAESAKLLGLAIYKIQEVWEGPNELQQANYGLRSLPKGLKFLWAEPPLESPKVMGLVGIYNPNALFCFNGMTHCPWCGKEGQNERIVINHLQMVRYRLGLVCDKCYNYPSMSSDTLGHHSWHNCQPSGEGEPDESALSE